MSVASWLVFAALMVPVVALCVAVGIWLNRMQLVVTIEGDVD